MGAGIHEIVIQGMGASCRMDVGISSTALHIWTHVAQENAFMGQNLGLGLKKMISPRKLFTGIKVIKTL